MKTYTLHNLYLYIVLVTILLSQILFINTSYGVISFALILSIPLLSILLLTKRSILYSKYTIGIYLAILTMSFYAFAGAFKREQITLLTQTYTYALIPFLFLHIGYNYNAQVIIPKLLITSVISCLFAISQFLYYSIGVNGPASLFAVISEFSIKNQALFLSNPIYGRATGLFSNPNELGFYGGLSFWFYAYTRALNNKKYTALGMSISLILVTLSFSRASILSLFLSIIVVYLINTTSNKTSGRKIIRQLFLIIIVTYLFYKLSFYFTESQLSRLSEIFNLLNGDHTGSDNLNARTIAWKDIMEYVGNNFFGTITPPIMELGISPDNQFIYFLAQGGWILAVLTILFYIYLIKLTSIQSKLNNYTSIGFMLFLLLNSLAMPTLNSFLIFIFWIVIGMHIRSLKTNITVI